MIRLDLLVAGRVGHPAPGVRRRHAVRGRLLRRRRGRPPRVADGGGQRGEPGLGPAVPPRDVGTLLLLLRLGLGLRLGGVVEPLRPRLGLPTHSTEPQADAVRPGVELDPSALRPLRPQLDAVGRLGARAGVLAVWRGRGVGCGLLE